jgi:hypothetical protein
MHGPTEKVKRFFVATTTLAVFASAHADVKLVAHLHIDQGGTTRPDQIVTTYYKGSLIRAESGDAVTLTDTKTGLTAVLIPSSKTFKQYNNDQLGRNTSELQGLKVDGHANVTQTSEHKVIAGKNATKFVADVDLTMTNANNVGYTQHTTMHIVRWTTADLAIAIPPEVLAKFSVEQRAFQGISGMEGVNKELAKITGVPLSSEVTIKSEFTGPQGVGGVPPPMTEDINTDVESVDESDLDNSLFQIPPDYKKVSAQGHLPGPGGGGA